MMRVQLFAQRERREQRAEQRHQRNRLARACRAQRRDGGVEQRKSDDRGQQRHVEHRGEHARRPVHHGDLVPFGGGQWEHREHADREGDREEARGMKLRAEAQQRGVKGPGDHAAQDQRVATIESDLRQRAELALEDNHDDAERRQRDTDDRTDPCARAEDEEVDEQYQSGDRRLHQQAIGRRGVAQPGIKEAVECGDAEQAQEEDHRPAPCDRCTILGDVAGGEGGDHQQSARPAQQCEKQRRYVFAYRAADDRIARPEQHHQCEHAIRGGLGTQADHARPLGEVAPVRQTEGAGRPLTPQLQTFANMLAM
ncbi:hypothetical protein PIB19_19825 [Sphingomonas sp. 7/4-4]|nr:hypothetical protein [Sphingomonas sp. 7/4-4]WBY07551.1 hypothetical protein PIB19_19825 [Sphingomonas sp. 7/4-4]